MAKALIVDDDKMVRRIITQILRFEGFVVDEAMCGAEGFSMIEKNNYDIVLCDIEMPNMTGIELVEKVSKLNIHTKVIMLSIHNDIATIVETIKKGAFDFISKPIEPDRFLHVIRKHTILDEN